jgi:hypothetical protein
VFREKLKELRSLDEDMTRVWDGLDRADAILQSLANSIVWGPPRSADLGKVQSVVARYSRSPLLSPAQKQELSSLAERLRQARSPEREELVDNAAWALRDVWGQLVRRSTDLERELGRLIDDATIAGT